MENGTFLNISIEPQLMNPPNLVDTRIYNLITVNYTFFIRRRNNFE